MTLKDSFKICSKRPDYRVQWHASGFAHQNTCNKNEWYLLFVLYISKINVDDNSSTKFIHAKSFQPQYESKPDSIKSAETHNKSYPPQKLEFSTKPSAVPQIDHSYVALSIPDEERGHKKAQISNTMNHVKQSQMPRIESNQQYNESS